jgi:hypothetical protein
MNDIIAYDDKITCSNLVFAVMEDDPGVTVVYVGYFKIVVIIRGQVIIVVESRAVDAQRKIVIEL